MRLTTKENSRLGFKFENQSFFLKFKTSLNGFGCTCVDLKRDQGEINYFQPTFPNLSDPAVQEIVIRLMFTEGFESFVSDLEDIIDGIACDKSEDKNNP